MGHILTSEFKSSVCNLRFMCGVLLIFIAALIIGHPYAKQLLDTGYSAEGIGWLSAYTYCVTAGNTLLFIPIAAPLAAGGNAELELRTRFSLFYCSRTGKKPYLFGKIIGAAISGGLMVVIAMLLLLGVCFLQVRAIPAAQGQGTDAAGILLSIILSLLRGFLNGALWALVGSLSAVVTRNRYMAYAVPFIFYYVLSVFQERYYQKLFFLSPRYWAAPGHYGNLFCIGILLACSLIAAFLFMWTGKRRLAHA